MTVDERELKSRRSRRLGLEFQAVFHEPEQGIGTDPNTPEPYEAEIEHSKAVSLKRIADQLDRLRIEDGELPVYCRSA